MHALPLATVLLALPAGPAGDWILLPGQEAEYDTRRGALVLDRLHIQAGATLRVVGERPFLLEATVEVRVDGRLDLSGHHAPGVTTLNTTNQPELGAAGGPGGGRGGTGSRRTTQSTEAGGAGYGAGALVGGGGGESGYSDLGQDARRAAGGGGGALAAARPVHPDPLHPSNRGLLALRGWPGGALGTGAVSQSARAQGGDAGASVFVDGDPRNDHWGREVTAAGVIAGELAGPVGGRGGGAGGDAVASTSFPLVPFDPSGDEKGAGGGGGGGLGLILTRAFVLGPGGRVRADGGAGGGGENTLFFDRVGGGSGGGSGGMVVIEALWFDLSQAGPDAITALGGDGAPGADNQPQVDGAGGQGGPGILQLHTPDGTAASLQLPPGLGLADLTSPDAKLLLPVLR